MPMTAVERMPRAIVIGGPNGAGNEWFLYDLDGEQPVMMAFGGRQ
jgi:hypothetical protein